MIEGDDRADGPSLHGMVDRSGFVGGFCLCDGGDCGLRNLHRRRLAILRMRNPSPFLVSEGLAGRLYFQSETCTIITVARANNFDGRVEREAVYS